MERHFEDHEMAMLYQKYRLDYKGTSVGKDIVNLLYKQLKKDTYSLAVDTGCGTGFLARLLAPHFSKILGVDVSEAQIKVAKDVTEAQNVEYRVCRAEKMPFLGNNTVDLVTVAMAIQYLDTNEFFVEVDRVLKPGGCLAVIMYEYRQGCCMVALKASDTQHSAVNDKLQSLVEEISFLGVQQLGSGSKKMFQNKTLPCPNYPTSHHLQVSTEREGVLSDIMGYLKSKGGLRMYQKQHTEDGNIYDQYEQRFVSVLKEVSPFPDTVRLTIGTVLHCHVYRKPLIPHQ